MTVEPDFSGWATKANLRCSDGRTIMPDAFKHQDQTTVPLVWAHAHNEPANILGHVILHNREEGVYCEGYFNDTDSGISSKKIVKHKDIKSLSIYANQLVEKSKSVVHGVIREVSLVLAGANPGAVIDFVNIAHSDGSFSELADEAIISMGVPIEHIATEETVEDVVEHAETKTVKDVFETMNDQQKDVVYFMIGQALANGSSKSVAHADTTPDGVPIKPVLESLNEEQRDSVYYMVGEALEHADQNQTDDTAAHADEVVESTGDAVNTDSPDTTAAHADNKEGSTIMTNVFEQGAGPVKNTHTLSHSDMESLLKKAKRAGSLKEAVMAYAEDTLQHGIDDIDILFPDAKAITSTPEWLARRSEWVSDVLTNTRHTPYSRIKSLTANLTLPEARAKGYIKGNFKKEEFFRIAKRITGPTTIYKKQGLDRDDIVDITDFNVVAWIKAEMRVMLEEELARAILLGDGRAADDEDKVNEESIRPIATDNDLFVTRIYVDVTDTDYSAESLVDALTLQRRHYRGSGNPTFYCSETTLSQLLLVKDTTGRRIYNTVADLTAALRVSKIVTVELMDEPAQNVLGILVNLQDYNIGTDRGGEVSLFDDFDLDFNRYLWLIETRCSGALVKAKSALVINRTAGNSTLVDPVAPSWNNTTKQVTVATTTGIQYRNKLSNTVLTTASPVQLTEGDELTVIAVPTTGNHLASTASDEFYFTYENGRVDTAFGFGV